MFISSLKLTVISAEREASIAPFVGMVLLTVGATVSSVVKVLVYVDARALPESSSAVVVTSIVQDASFGKSLVGLNTNCESSTGQLIEPVTLPPQSNEKADSVAVVFISSLKLTVIFVVRLMSVAPFVGMVLLTVGAITSSVVNAALV